MSAGRAKWATALRWYVAALLFLAPLKFGGMIGLGDDPFFPLDGWQWAFFVWPPFLLAPLAGIAFVLSLAVHPGPVKGSGRWVVVAWSALAFAVLPGLARTTEWEYALPFVCHLASAAVLAAAVRRMLAHDEAARALLLAAICGAALLSCVHGVHQHFVGLERTRAEAHRQAAAEGRALAGGMSDKLEQTRVYGAFQIANLYAAHLVLASPLLLLLLWRLGGRFEPTRVSRPLLAGLGGLLFAGALYWSGSRGAVLGLGAGLALAGLSWPRLRRWRVPVALVALALGAGLVFVVGSDRNLLSASARIQYYRSAWLMFRDHPVAGAGLGEFFPQHLRLRPLGAEPARMPHNMPLGLLGQAGILAGLAALACLLLPAWTAFSRPEEDPAPPDPWQRLAVVVGLGAWSAHALVELNVQVPGTVLTAACLPLLALGNRAASGEETGPAWRERVAGSALLALCAFALLSIWRLPGEYRFQLLGEAIRTRQPMLAVLAEGRAAARWLPTSPNPDRIMGYQMEAAGDWFGAAEAYERAVARAPHRPGGWSQLARARLLAGDLPGAAAAIAVAAEWNPGHPQYQAFLALVRSLRGNAGKPPAVGWQGLLRTALGAEYALDRKAAKEGAMTVVVGWTAESAPPLPPPELASWLAPWAGTFASHPVRFRAAAAWTNGE